MQNSTPRLILICGLPGAGKTTLARRLESELSAIRLCGDEWMATLGIDLYDEEARERLEQLFWQHGRELLKHGLTVILESGFWQRSDRDEKRLYARSHAIPIELHHLDVPLEERWSRIQQRNAAAPFGSVPIPKEKLAGWEVFFETPAAAEVALYDAPAGNRSGT